MGVNAVVCYCTELDCGVSKCDGDGTSGCSQGMTQQLSGVFFTFLLPCFLVFLPLARPTPPSPSLSPNTSLAPIALQMKTLSSLLCHNTDTHCLD